VSAGASSLEEAFLQLTGSSTDYRGQASDLDRVAPGGWAAYRNEGSS
jgi:hypothetical protein